MVLVKNGGGRRLAGERRGQVVVTCFSFRPRPRVLRPMTLHLHLLQPSAPVPAACR